MLRSAGRHRCSRDRCRRHGGYRMDGTRKLRSIRRAVMVLSVVVLLPVWYLLSYGTLYWYLGYDSAKGGQSQLRDVAVGVHDVLYLPLDRYRWSEWPGHSFLQHFVCW